MVLNSGIPPPKMTHIDPLYQLENVLQQEEEVRWQYFFVLYMKVIHKVLQLVGNCMQAAWRNSEVQGALKQDHKKLLDAQEHLRHSHELKTEAQEKTSEVMNKLKESHIRMYRRCSARRETLKWN